MQLCDKNTIFAINGNSIKDLSQSKIAITNVGVTISQIQSKNFKNALYFNGSSRLLLDQINLGSSNFTIDWWEYVTSSSSESRFCSMYTSSSYGGLLLGYNGTLVYASSALNNSWNMISGVSMFSNTLNEWVHWAVVRNGTTLTSYRNGVVFATTTMSGSVADDAQYKTVIGDYRSGDPSPFIGYIDSFRISNIARWTSAFTPPEYGMPIKTKAKRQLTVLPYLESTGTQYIDTGFVPNHNTRIDMIVTPTSIAEAGNASGFIPYGSGVSYNSQAFECYTSQSQFEFNYGNQNIFVGTPVLNQKITISHNKNIAVINNGTQDYTATFDSSAFTAPYTMTLFAIHRSSVVCGLQRIHECQIYDNDTLVRDYIPVLDFDGIPCLYDKVNSQFYYNQGTGQFFYTKPVALPEGYHQLEYITSTGTQYINTNYLPNNNTRIVMDVYLPTQSSYPTALFGGRDADTTTGDSYSIWLMTSTTFRTDFDTGTTTINVTPVGRFLIDKNKATTTINSTAYANAAATFQSDYAIALLSQIDAGGVDTRFTKANLYTTKVYDCDTLIRDYVPCISPSGTVGMYDIVENKFYANAGSGTFTAGNEIENVSEDISIIEWVEPKSIRAKTYIQYTRLEYIQGTGTQYIDTNYLWKSDNVKVEMQYEYTAVGSNSLFGSETSTPQYGICAYHPNTTQLAFWVGGSQQLLASTVTTGTRYHLTTETNGGKFYASLNGTKTSVAYSGSVQNGRTLYIFANNIQSGVSQYSKIKLYSCKMYDNDFLVRDFIPVKKADGTVCLFDRVTNAFFENKGTGTFTGKEISYTPLDYISSTGTQFINTKWNFGSDNYTDVKIRFKAVIQTANASGWAVSGCGSNTNLYIGTGNNSRILYYGNGNSDVSTGATYTEDECIFEVDFKNKTVKVTQESTGNVYVDLQNITLGTPSTASLEYYLFAYHSVSDGKAYPHSAKMYWYEIYENDVLIRHMIPVKDSSNTVCMFDLFENVFYYNAGSGTFTEGVAVDSAYTESLKSTPMWITPQSVYVKTTEDLVELDYIESSGTQYIDTGFIPNQDTRVVAEVELKIDGTNYFLFGARQNSTNNSVASVTFGFNAYQTKYRTHYYNGWTDFDTTISFDTKFTIDKNKNVTTLNNEHVITRTYSEFTSPCTMTIFAVNTAGKIGTYGTAKVYSFKIYDNDTLIRDYIPVLDSSGVACLYDKVTNQCFYNQGTGTFTAGYKTEFEPETELAFLESTGTQYIDTEFKPNQDTRVIVDCEFAMPSSDGALFGARTTSNDCEFVVYGRPSGYQFGYGSSRVTVSTTSISGRYIVDANKNSITMNGMISVATVSTFSTPVTLYLFAYNNKATGIEDKGKSRIYSCKIYDNGTLVRDYIPKTDTQGVPALFDKISGTYYYNQGTGTFNAGTILKRPYWKQVA